MRAATMRMATATVWLASNTSGFDIMISVTASSALSASGRDMMACSITASSGSTAIVSALTA